MLAYQDGEYERAATLYQVALAETLETEDLPSVAPRQTNLAFALLLLGEPAKAVPYLRAALAEYVRDDYRLSVASCFIGLSVAAAASARPTGAGRLLGAARRVIDDLEPSGQDQPSDPWQGTRMSYDQALEAHRRRIDADVLTQALDEGQAMSYAQAVACGLDSDSRHSS
jgi:hypothetical protein